MKRFWLLLAFLGLVIAASGASKPNFVIFIADDLSYCDLPGWGCPDTKTPNLERLAADGVKLTRCYTPAPICSPTRLALYTALYPVKNGGHPNHSAVKAGTESIVHYMRPLGYRVGIVGKTMYAPKESFPFDLPRSKTAQAEYEKAKAWKNEGKKTSGDEGEGEDADLDFGAIKEYINKDKAQPFCLTVASHQPHGPWNKGDVSAYNPKNISVPPYLIDTPQLREERSHYLAEITFLDAEVGRVMKILDESGQAENTLFIFLSEQGSGFPGGKYNLYDVGIRSATIARWPGKIKAGTTNDALCSYVDIVPTLIEAAGGKAIATLDGRSLLPGLTDGKTKSHDYVFGIATALGVKGVSIPYGIRCVVDDRYKYILNLHPHNEFPCSHGAHNDTLGWLSKAKTNTAVRDRLQHFLHRPAVELYDLKNDPWEQKNVATDPANRENLVRLRRELDSWMKDQGDMGRQTELDADKHLKKNLKAQKQASVKL